MKNWQWRKIGWFSGAFLTIVGLAPISWLFLDSFTHPLQLLAVSIPLELSEFTSPTFKPGHDTYMVQMELMDSGHRSRDLNREAVLDLDWKIVDASSGTVLREGELLESIGMANSTNLGDYEPKQYSAQRIVVHFHRKLEEPPGTRVTLDLNSSKDPEAFAFAFYPFLGWAAFVAGPGIIILCILVANRARRKGSRQETVTP
ncbi:MAG: hypothetical protein P4K83_07310 [Terracidiphilus sp.]|nr:hypothetical protein [Terracidiphilus sp.]